MLAPSLHQMHQDLHQDIEKAPIGITEGDFDLLCFIVDVIDFTIFFGERECFVVSASAVHSNLRVDVVLFQFLAEILCLGGQTACIVAAPRFQSLV